MSSVEDPPDGMSSTCEAALTYARLGWPVFPLRPREKTPATAHGFEDASVDEDQIRRWWTPASLTNIAIVTGAPGPCVVDVDAPEHFPPELAAQLTAVHPPTVATARGTHYYFAGTDETTIALRAGEHKYGELRGKGSYVAAPPSVHPSGKLYVWTSELNGALPARPIELGLEAVSRGAGELTLSGRNVPHSERHDFLLKLALRLVRSGEVLDEDLLITMLGAAFGRHCDPNPPPRASEFRDLARWALRSDIAERERSNMTTKKGKDGREKKVKLSGPPPDAPLTDHRAFVERLIGLGGVPLGQPVRHGPSLSDPCDIPLGNGMIIELARLGDILTTPRAWPAAVKVATDGHANPMYNLTTEQRLDLLGSLCILAGIPEKQVLRQALRDAVEAFIALTVLEPVMLVDGVAKYALIASHYERPNWRPDREVPDKRPHGRFDDPPPVRPWLIHDLHENIRYVVSGNLFDYLRWKGQVNASDYEGRLSGIGLTRRPIYGREASREDARGPQRRRNAMHLVEIPMNWMFDDEDMPGVPPDA